MQPAPLTSPVGPTPGALTGVHGSYRSKCMATKALRVLRVLGKRLEAVGTKLVLGYPTVAKVLEEHPKVPKVP
jgi:hypothetical protein